MQERSQVELLRTLRAAFHATAEVEINSRPLLKGRKRHLGNEDVLC